jgi:hypothetical protein
MRRGGSRNFAPRSGQRCDYKVEGSRYENSVGRMKVDCVMPETKYTFMISKICQLPFSNSMGCGSSLDELGLAPPVLHFAAFTTAICQNSLRDTSFLSLSKPLVEEIIGGKFNGK